MNNLLLSGICILIILSIVVIMFTKLKKINKYNITIFIFLVVFWSVMAVMKKTSLDKNSIDFPEWAWALIIASYQFTQVITRIPMGLLSKKLKSRQMPILLSTTTITMSLILIVATNMSTWSVILGLIFTGLFGATFGMQNQYWSENYNMKKVFITIAIVAIIPSLGSLIGDFSKSLITKFNVDSTRWVLLGIAAIMFFTSIAYFIFPERKETIKLDNVKDDNHKKIFDMDLKEIFKLSLQIIFISFAFNIVIFEASYQDDISSSNGQIPILLTFSSILAGLFVVIILMRVLRIRGLFIASHLIMIFGLILALIFNIHPLKNKETQKSMQTLYLILVTIGFSIYQNVKLGTMLHFDHKNSYFVLGIWLTIRSAAIGTGQLTGRLIEDSFPKWGYEALIGTAIGLTTISLGTILMLGVKDKQIKHLLNTVEKYEFYSFVKAKQELMR